MLRDMATNGAGCAPEGEAGGSGGGVANPLSQLADTLLGRGKTVAPGQAAGVPLLGPGDRPGAGAHAGRLGPHRPGGGFLTPEQAARMGVPWRGTEGAPPSRLRQGGGVEGDGAWAAEFQPGPSPPGRGGLDEAWGEALARRPLPPPPGPMASGGPVASTLRNFLHGAPPSRLPPGVQPALGPDDAARLRDRATIVSRHLHSAGRGEAFAEAAVAGLLDSLGIRAAGHSSRGAGGPLHADYVPSLTSRARAEGWASEFAAKPSAAEGWAGEFQGSRAGPSEVAVAAHPIGSAWADEFVTGGQASTSEASERLRADPAARAHSAAVVDELARNADPRFRSSQFFQFMSKMSHGEVMVDRQEATHTQAAGSAWADEFGTHNQLSPAAEEWASAFQPSYPSSHAGTLDAEQAAVSEWAEQFGAGVDLDSGAGVGASWAQDFEREVDQSGLSDAARAPGLSGTHPYSMRPGNAYVDHPDPLSEGKRLFRSGALNDAVLAFEAAVQREGGTSEGGGSGEAWRLLGVTHAENDDDLSAIACMVRALALDPTNLEVLISLGVSHTNELERSEAQGYLRAWMENHPRHRHLTSAFGLGSPVVELFSAAAQEAPDDADLFTVLGVLHNLTGQHDEAVRDFRRALALRPQDYSLWNKLGATCANSARSHESIEAYERALSVKPNYVRAWSNLGIAFANLGQHAESIRHFFRALRLNPDAESVWGYLRVSLGVLGRPDAQALSDSRRLDDLEQMMLQ